MKELDNLIEFFHSSLWVEAWVMIDLVRPMAVI